MVIFEQICERSEQTVCEPRNSEVHLLKEWCGDKVGASRGE